MLWSGDGVVNVGLDGGCVFSFFMIFGFGLIG